MARFKPIRRRSLVTRGKSKGKAFRSAIARGVRGRQGRMIINRFPSIGFPDKIIMKHRYVETIGVTAAVGSPSVYQYQCNGMFDPNSTGTGHQPMYYDQMTALYDHYTVIGSKCRIIFQATTSPPVLCGGYIEDDTTVPVFTNMSGFMEQTHGKFKAIPLTGDQVKWVTLKWNGRIARGERVKLADDTMSAATNANPVEQSLYTIVFGAADNVATVTVAFTVIIDYIAVWTELKKIGQS